MNVNLNSSNKSVDSAVKQVLENRNAVYVSKRGVDTNTGLNINRPVLTFTQAIANAITASIPLVVCMDSGSYSETVDLTDADIQIYAPWATITSADETATLTLTDYESTSWIGTVANSGDGVAILCASSETLSTNLNLSKIDGGVTKTGTATLNLSCPNISGTITDDSLKIQGDVFTPVSATIVPTAAAENVCEVAISLVDGFGNVIPKSAIIDVYLSDSATGAGLTSTSASGTVAAKSASGTDLFTFTSKKMLKVKTLATGIYTLEITDSAKTGFYVVVVLNGGTVLVGAQLETADYGAGG